MFETSFFVLTQMKSKRIKRIRAEFPFTSVFLFLFLLRQLIFHLPHRCRRLFKPPRIFISFHSKLFKANIVFSVKITGRGFSSFRCFRKFESQMNRMSGHFNIAKSPENILNLPLSPMNYVKSLVRC